MGGEHVKECWAVPRGREERAALQCLFGNLTQLATFLSVCEIGHLSLFALWHFFFRAVFWGTPAVLVMYAAGVGSSGQSKTNTPLSLSLSHSLRKVPLPHLTQSERNKDLSVAVAPGRARPPRPLLCHALLLPTRALFLFQAMFSQTGSSVFSILLSLLEHTFGISFKHLVLKF